MKTKRSPVTDPQPGDVLGFKGGWQIRVVSRTPEAVEYVATKGQQSKEQMQTLAEWSAWSGEAKVLERGDQEQECIPTERVSGPCMKCHKALNHPAHMSERGVFHPECCPMAKHGAMPKKKAAPLQTGLSA